MAPRIARCFFLVSLTVCCASEASAAPRDGKRPQVGVLLVGSPDYPTLKGFLHGLNDAGSVVTTGRRPVQRARGADRPDDSPVGSSSGRRGHPMMTAARLVVMLALGILAAPLAVEAQSPGKIPRIGVLAAGIPTTYTSRYEAFRQGLREFGYVEGQTIIMEYRYAEGKFERLEEA